MVYVTADLHGDADRFNSKEIRQLKKGDTLIVLGDFGFLWQDTPKEKKFLKKLGKKKYQILFLDGAHENFDLLEQYPLEDWSGGQVRRIEGNLLYLTRGQVYVIEGKRIFVMGGGEKRRKGTAFPPAEVVSPGVARPPANGRGPGKSGAVSLVGGLCFDPRMLGNHEDLSFLCPAGEQPQSIFDRNRRKIAVSPLVFWLLSSG